MKVLMALGTAFAFAWSTPAHAQDYNYVPGWSNTTNHQYRGSSGKGEWVAKNELFAKLGAQGSEAKCALKNISEADGNVITNQYRSESRKSGEGTALKNAQRKVAAHFKALKAKGRC
ncbi:hypothetical protein [Schauerella aestuarii]|uniref:hypothetical protein n=1 Tax=Schauerella aestuarii TaxID=2511204 RepID=UPI0013692553|nr:hypothetical protein [Achromobacter aestuarii]MYZ43326.1 hypothetical protein [Achromobacter aestuarii]